MFSNTFLDLLLPEAILNILVGFNQIFPYLLWLALSVISLIISITFIALYLLTKNSKRMKVSKVAFALSLLFFGCFVVFEDAHMTTNPIVVRTGTHQGLSFPKACEAKKLFDFSTDCIPSPVDIPF